MSFWSIPAKLCIAKNLRVAFFYMLVIVAHLIRNPNLPRVGTDKIKVHPFPSLSGYPDPSLKTQDDNLRVIAFSDKQEGMIMLISGDMHFL